MFNQFETELYDFVRTDKVQISNHRNDAESIWNRLYDFVEKTISDETIRPVKTQEMFLQLLGEGRINHYIEEEWSDAEIENEFKGVI